MEPLNYSTHTFQSLIASRDLATPQTKGRLRNLSAQSTDLFNQLAESNINKNEVLIKICQIASEWRILMSDRNEGIGTDDNRFKLAAAFENILNKVKLKVTEKQAEEKRKASEEAAPLEQERGWLGWATSGMIATAATTCGFMIGLLKGASTYVMP